MIVTLLVRAAIIYMVYLLIRNIWKSFSPELKDNGHKNGVFRRSQQQNDDIVDADYTVIKEKDIGDKS